MWVSVFICLILSSHVHAVRYSKTLLVFDYCLTPVVLPKVQVDRHIQGIYECMNNANRGINIPITRLNGAIKTELSEFIERETVYEQIQLQMESEDLDLKRYLIQMQQRLLRTYFELQYSVAKIELPFISHQNLENTFIRVAQYIQTVSQIRNESLSIISTLDSHIKTLHTQTDTYQQAEVALRQREMARSNFTEAVATFKHSLYEEYNDGLPQ